MTGTAGGGGEGREKVKEGKAKGKGKEKTRKLTKKKPIRRGKRGITGGKKQVRETEI
jgi:hypothetical protein